MTAVSKTVYASSSLAAPVDDPVVQLDEREFPKLFACGFKSHQDLFTDHRGPTGLRAALF